VTIVELHPWDAAEEQARAEAANGSEYAFRVEAERIYDDDETLRRFAGSKAQTEVLHSLIYLRLAGRDVTLSGAARDAGVHPGTARSWRSRDKRFGVAVEHVLDATAPVEPPTPAEQSRASELAQAEAEIERLTGMLRYEKSRRWNDQMHDVPGAERLLRTATEQRDFLRWQITGTQNTFNEAS
jgi:hypothetical protein